MQAGHPRAEPQRIKEKKWKKDEQFASVPPSHPRGENPIPPPPPPPVKGFPSFLLRFIRSAIPFIHSPTRCLSACLKKEEIGERARSNQRTSIYVQRTSSPKLLIHLLFHIVRLLTRSSTRPFTYSGVRLLTHRDSSIIRSSPCVRSFMESTISAQYSESGNHESKNLNREQVKPHKKGLS